METFFRREGGEEGEDEDGEGRWREKREEREGCEMKENL